MYLDMADLVTATENDHHDVFPHRDTAVDRKKHQGIANQIEINPKHARLGKLNIKFLP